METHEDPLPAEILLVEPVGVRRSTNTMLKNDGTNMADPELTLKQVVSYCQEHELLLRLLGIDEGEIIRHNAAERSRIEGDYKRKAIDGSTRSAIDELVRIRILRQELNQDKRFLYPGELWSNRVDILEAREDR